VSTTLDVRTKAEVTADTEIGAGASKRCWMTRRRSGPASRLLVFAQHVVLAGAVKTEEVKKRVEELVKRDARIRSLKNELVAGGAGSLARDTPLEAEINAGLTAAKGVASVNMPSTERSRAPLIPAVPSLVYLLLAVVRE